MPFSLAASSLVPETFFPGLSNSRAKVHTNLLKFLLPAPEEPHATKQYIILEQGPGQVWDSRHNKAHMPAYLPLISRGLLLARGWRRHPVRSCSISFLKMLHLRQALHHFNILPSASLNFIHISI